MSTEVHARHTTLLLEEESGQAAHRGAGEEFIRIFARPGHMVGPATTDSVAHKVGTLTVS